MRLRPCLFWGGRYRVLEPDEGKLSSPVLRGLSGRKAAQLPGTYLASALHALCGEPIPAPLKCRSVGRGTSVPTGNTDACRWTEDASRTEPATVGAWRQTTTRKGSTEAT